MQDKDSNPYGMQIQVTESQAIQYNRRLHQFQQGFAKMNEQYQNSQQKDYYLVSTRFVNQWKNFCRSNSSTRLQPQPMNSDLIDPTKKQLAEGLVQTENFLILNKKLFSLFEGFPTAQILKRVAYGSAGQKRVPIYITKMKFLTLNIKDLQLIDKKVKNKQSLALRQLKSLSIENTVEDLINQIRFQQLLNKQYRCRLWVHKQDVTNQVFYSHIAKQCKPLAYDKMAIRGLGKRIDEVDKKIAETSNIQQGDYFVLECILYDKTIITAEDEGRCEQCRSYGKLTHQCQCKMVSYCSQKCYDADRRYHMARCKFIEQQQMNKPVVMNIRQNSRLGLVGLENLGNTCFMNSCLQCLSHTLLLTNYFLKGEYAPEINKQNPIGSKGKLAQSYANFIKNMWCQQQSVYRPSRLKSSIADINKMFSGYAQHDSQQLFSFLVDGLHQDLNRIKKKPYVQSVDSNGRQDDIVSKQSWLTYIQRNQSIISDTMVGQYKSVVVCPDCQKQSITFDPFITVTLPIPQKQMIQYKFYVLFKDFEESTIKINLLHVNKNLDQVLQKVAQIIEKDKNQIRGYVLTFEQNAYSFHNTPANQLLQKLQGYSSQTAAFIIQLTPQEIQIKNMLQIVTRFSKITYGRFQSFWFKRPFYFQLQTTTGLDIAKRILKYFYAEAYDHSVNRSKSSSKTYEEYEQFMLKNRPFKILLRTGKKIRSAYGSHIQYQFQQDKIITDQQKIATLIEGQKQGTYELDIRFSQKGLDQFTIDKLKNYTDKTKKNQSQSSQSKTVSLDACFQALEQPQKLEQGNQWYCSNCKDHKLANKQLYLYKTPEVLILHIKRFKQKNQYRKMKNETNVQFPFQLDMRHYITNPHPINDYIPYVKQKGAYIQPSYKLEELKNPSTIYELYAVSNHYGALGGGHYTAYAKNKDRWYSFNDSSVSAVSPDRVQGSGAYILFYRRKAATNL